MREGGEEGKRGAVMGGDEGGGEKGKREGVRREREGQ